MKHLSFWASILVLILSVEAFAQTRTPSTSSKPVVVTTGKQLTDIYKSLGAQGGNKNQDIVPAAGVQMRVAVFHDEKREGDNFEVHDTSDDIYYVLEGEATLVLGGSLSEAKEISPGEWRSKTASGGKEWRIRKGDLIVVPRGTVHQRTVTGRGFSMILIKVFAEPGR
jgi:mannose-6-phosphate isomerase-like protein (cupin superfamily)